MCRAWEYRGISVPSPRFYCNPTTALKIKSLKKSYPGCFMSLYVVFNTQPFHLKANYKVNYCHVVTFGNGYVLNYILWHHTHTHSHTHTPQKEPWESCLHALTSENFVVRTFLISTQLLYVLTLCTQTFSKYLTLIGKYLHTCFLYLIKIEMEPLPF